MPNNAWYAKNLADIKRRIEGLRKKPDGFIYGRREPDYRILVFKDGKQIQLYFGDSRNSAPESKISGVMSRLDLDNPLDLLSCYTQAMMLSLAWKSDPARVCMLGFGGGRVAMIFHHYFPKVIIDGVEIDHAVLEVAKRYFGIETDRRLRVAVQDARDFLTDCPDHRLYDIILLDCYTGIGHNPFHLSTIEFYRLCKARLAANGVVTTNLIRDDRLFARKVETFAASFKHLYRFTHEDTCVLFGSDAPPIAKSDLPDRMKRVCGRHPFCFPLLERAREVRRLRYDFENRLEKASDEGLLSDGSPPT